MDYQVAIPSYRRHAILPVKTLKVLDAAGVPHDRITVFVASHHEADLYRSTCPATIRIVIGVLGLAAQRAFIQNYYTRGQRIVFVDDDIKAVMRLDVGAPTKRLTHGRFTDLVEEGFREAEKAGARIWGVYPAANALFMSNRPPITTECAYIIGALYGIVNTDPPVLTHGDNQEDKERTLRYYMADGCVVRLNFWTIQSDYYAPGGMDSATRKAETEAATQKLADEFPHLVKRIHKSVKGYWDLRFVSIPKSTHDGKDDTVMALPLRPGYEAARDALLVELQKPGIKLRKLVKSPPADRSRHGTRGDAIGDVGHSITLGYGNTREFGIGEFSWNRKYPDLLRALINFGNVVVPPGWRYTAITLNKNVLAKRHVDGNNVGRSVIVGIGDYTGGELRVWGPRNGADHEDVDLKDRPTFFNGALRFHETQPFEGERWTIIYYKQKHQGTCVGMPAMRGDPSDLGGWPVVVEELPVDVGGDSITYE